MKCGVTVKASNGNPSELYSTLLESTKDAKVAYKIYLNSKSDNFKSWFGNSTNVDENGEPIVKSDNFYNGNTYKSIYNGGNFGKRITVADAMSWVQSGKDNIVSKRKHDKQYWIKTGTTEDGVNLHERNLNRLHKVNEDYYRDYNQPLYNTKKVGRLNRNIVSVNNMTLSMMNDEVEVHPKFAAIPDMKVDYRLRLIDALAKINRNIYTADKAQGWLNDLKKQGVPANQIELFSKYAQEGLTKDELIIELASSINQPVNINNTNSRIYSKLAVDGGVGYTESEIQTPDIVPIQQGHAKFSTRNGIGWVRYDTATPDLSNLISEAHLDELRVLEFQSDLFQKNRDTDILTTDGIVVSRYKESAILGSVKIEEFYADGAFYYSDVEDVFYHDENQYEPTITYYKNGSKTSYNDFYSAMVRATTPTNNPKYNEIQEQVTKGNEFLNLLMDNNNWVKFFIGSIVQNAVKKEYNYVLFPTGNTASIVEGITTLEKEMDDIKSDIESLTDARGNPEKYTVEHKFDKDALIYSVDINNGSVRDVNKDNFLKSIDIRVGNLTDKLEHYESTSVESLKPIEHFYQNRVYNTLKKMYGTVNNYIDDSGNSWFRLQLQPKHADTIKFAAIPDTRTIDNTVIDVESLGITTLSFNEEQYGINLATSLLLESSDTLDKLTQTDAIEGKSVRSIVIDDIRNISKASLASNDPDVRITKNQDKINNRIADELAKDSLFWNKVKISLKINSGIEIVDYDQLNIDENDISNTFDENLQFKMPYDTRVSSTIKNVINKLQNDDGNDIGGLGIFSRAADVIPYLAHNVGNARDVQDMMGTLDMLGNNNALYWDLHDELEADEDLRNLFFANFKSESPFRIANYFNNQEEEFADTMKTDIRNRTSYVSFQISDNWLSKLESNTQSKFYADRGIVDSFNSLYITYNELAGEAKVTRLVEMLNALGMKVTNQIIENAYANPANQARFLEDYSGTTEYGEPYNGIEDKAEAHRLTSFVDSLFNFFLSNTFNYINGIDSNPQLYGDLLKIGTALAPYYNPTTSAYINMTGNQEQSYNKNTFLGDWYNMMQHDDLLIEQLRSMAKDPKVKHSNWLFKTKDHDGFLLLPDGVNSVLELTTDDVNGLTEDNLNKDFYYNKKNNRYLFNYYYYDGFSDKTNNKSVGYSNIDNDDWGFINIANYYKGDNIVNVSDSAKENMFGLFSLLSPADTGNNRFLAAPKFTLNASQLHRDNTIDKLSSAYAAIENIFLGELSRIEAAYYDIYEIDEFGVPKKKNIKNLSEGYHYKVKEKNGKYSRSFIKNGRYIGEAFKFHHFKFVDDTGKTRDLTDELHAILEPGDRLDMDIAKNAKIMDNVVHPFIDAMIANMAQEQIDSNTANLVPISKISKESGNKTYQQTVTEYTVNRFIANVEQTNFFIGDLAFYNGNSAEANKRTKELIASGVVNVAYNDPSQTFRGATVRDFAVRSKLLKSIERVLKRNKVAPALIESTLDAYSRIDSTDGFSVITLDEFERRTKLYGINNRYSELIDNLRNPDTSAISIEDLNEVINAQKNFYYDYSYNSELGRMVPTQVKNSEFVLLPSFIAEDSQLKQVNDYMTNVNLSQLNFKTSEKVGSGYIGLISDTDGNLLKGFKSELELATKDYYYKSLRKQQDVMNHIIDAENKHGVQIQKKILDNVNDPTIVNEIFSNVEANIEEDSEALLNRLQVTTTTGFDGTSMTTPNNENLSRMMIEQHIARNSDSNYLYGSSLDVDGEFNLPLDMSITRERNEALLNSLFTNNVVNQKHPGIHGPQVSNVFMRSNMLESGVQKKSQLPTNTDLVYQHFTSKGVFVPTEVYLPMWSKKFFGRTIEGTDRKTDDITIEDLQKAGLDIMIGYRIPTENKNSIFVFKVKGFLDASQGSSIVVPPEFVAQTGSDFDIDSIYTMYYNFEKNPGVGLTKIQYTKDDANLNIRYVDYILATGDRTAKREITRELIDKANKSYSAYKGQVTKKKNENFKYLNEVRDKLKEVLPKLNPKVVTNLEEKFREVDGFKDATFIDKLVYVNEFIGKQVDLFENFIEDESKLKPNENELHDIFTDYLMANQWVGGVLDNLLIDKENLKAYKDSVIAKMYKNHWSIMKLNLAQTLIATSDVISLSEFKKLSIPRQNTRKARENNILDNYIKILSDEKNYFEMTSPNSFNNTVNSRKIADSLYNPMGSAINFASPTTQDSFRTRALWGRQIKGMSANMDSTVSIAQRIGLRIKNSNLVYKFNIGTPVTYNINGEKIVTNSYTIEQLQDYFGKENVKDDGTVTLTIFGKNAMGTYTNIDGHIITSYSSESTAHAFDNVKVPLPYGVSTEAMNEWRIIPDLGANWNMATLLTQQEAIELVNKMSTYATSITLSAVSNAVDSARNELLTKLFITKHAANDIEDAKADLKSIGFDWVLQKGLSEIAKVNKHKNSTPKLHPILTRYLEETRIGTNIVPSDALLAKQLTTRDNYDNLSNKDKIAYYEMQLDILDYFVKIRNITEQYDDFRKLTSYDKSKVGPSFSDINRLDDLYQAVQEDDYKVNGNQLVDEDGNHYIKSIYDLGKYPTIKAFKESGSDTSYRIFSSMFITQAPAIVDFLTTINESNKKAIINHILAYNLQTLEFFNNTDKAKLFGLTTQSTKGIDIAKYDKENIDKYNELSVYNKLLLVQEHYKEFIDEDSILYYLQSINNERYLKYNDYADIRFISDKAPDVLIDSFAKLWYNEDIYLHLLAKDLVKFSFFAKGLTFGMNLSKLIPGTVLHNEASTIHDFQYNDIKQSFGYPVTKGIGYTNHLAKQRNDHFSVEFHNPYDTVFNYNFARANWNRDSIVPNAELETYERYNKETGEYEKFPVKNRIEFDLDITKLSPLQQTLIVPEWQFRKMKPNVKKADVIKVRFDNEGTLDYRLWAKYRRVDSQGKSIYYYFPVTKLSQFEHGTNSFINEHHDKNVYDIDMYLRTISNIKEDVEDDTKDSPKTLFAAIPDANEDFIDYNASRINYHRSIASDYQTRAIMFPGDALISDVAKALRGLKWDDNLTAAETASFRIDADYMDTTISKLNDALFGPNGYTKNDVLATIFTDEAARHKFTGFMHHANVFVKGFKRIENLQTLDKPKLTEAEKQLNIAINRLTSFSKDINKLNAALKSLNNAYFEHTLTPMSTNPEIKLGIRKLFDAQDDESKVQLMMASLADTNNSFLATFIKEYAVKSGVNREDGNKALREFRSKLEKLNVSNIDSIIEKGDRLIQEFDDSYKEDRDELKANLLKAELNGKYTDEYYEAERALIDWTYENLLSEESKEVEAANIKVNDILYSNYLARERLDKIWEAKRKITANHIGVVDKAEIDEEDQNALNALRDAENRLQSSYNIDDGTKKEGVELEVATAINAYKKAHGEILQKYYVPVVNNTRYKNLLAKHKKSKTKGSKKWLERNTIVKLNDTFWNDFAMHSEILGKESTYSILKELFVYRDTDGIVNGMLVSDPMVDNVKEDTESRFADISESSNPKAISKVPTADTYNDEYYAQFTEENKGTDTRDSDEALLELNAGINTILRRYINDDGVLDTTSISTEDLELLFELQEEVTLRRSYGQSYDAIRDGFNTWWSDTHNGEVDEDAFNKANIAAGNISKAYQNRWRKINTKFKYSDEYFSILEELREDYGLMKSNVLKDRDVDSLNVDALRNIYKVESFNDLPADIRKWFILNNAKSNQYGGMTSDDIRVYTLSDYLTGHTLDGVDIKFSNIEQARATVADEYLEAMDNEGNAKSKPLHYRTDVDDMHDYTVTTRYKNRLKKHGKGSQWYNDNHYINFKGEITPIGYWTVTRPTDNTLYDNEAINNKYWGYSEIKDREAHIDEAKTKSKQWTMDNVDYVTTHYYDEMMEYAENNMSQEEYDEWYDKNHYFNPYTNKHEPIAIWTTMQSTDEYTEDYAPSPDMLDYNIKSQFSNTNEKYEVYRKAFNDINTKQLEPLADPFRSIFNKPLPTADSKYRNKNYDAYKDNELYVYINDLLKNLTSHYGKDTIIDEGRLPIVRDRAINDKKPIDKFIRAMGWFNFPNKEVIGENNDSVRILNMPFLSDLIKDGNQKIENPNPNEFPTREAYLERKIEVDAQNAEISKTNREYTNSHKSNDHVKVIESFISASYAHRFKVQQEHEMRMALEEIRNLDLTQRRNMLERLVNTTRAKLSKEQSALFEGDTPAATKKGINSNLEEHFRRFMDMIFYGEFESDEGTWTKIARVLQNATSAKGMWLNLPGAFNNVAYGRTQMALERYSGYFYSNSDAASADKEYIFNMANFLTSMGSDITTNETTAILKRFDIIQLQDELAATNSPELNKSIYKHLMSTDAFYTFHHIGEHSMQNTTLLAMMRSHRIIGGKAMSIHDYTYDKQYKAINNVMEDEGRQELEKFINENKFKDRYLDGKSNMIRDFILNADSGIQQEFLKELKSIEEKAKVSFESNPTVRESFELKNGLAEVKEGSTLTTEEIERFKFKVIGVNQKIHGIYNKFDAGTMQRKALGRLAMQFKKWLYPGLTKRFGSKVGKTFWNEHRSENDTGSYVDAFRFVTKPIFDSIHAVKNESIETAEAFQAIMDGYSKYISNIGLYWHTMSETEKANVKRTGIEMMAFGVFTLMLMSLRGLGDEDDQDKKWYAYSLYLTDRLRTETIAYSPAFGFTNETRKIMRDPFAAMSFLDDTFKLAYTAMFESDKYYKGGIYHGEHKLTVQTYKNIPLLNRRLRYNNIQDYAGYYKLF